MKTNNNINDSNNTNNKQQISNFFGDEFKSIIIGNPRVVVYQLLELISPIAFNHGVNFLAAVAVAWHERKSTTTNNNNNNNDNTDDKIINDKNCNNGFLSFGIKKILPEACINQQIIVDLVGAIRVMPIDTLIKTVNQVIKNPPIINGVKKNFSLQVSVLELLYVYIKQTNITAQSLVECWSALLGLLRDSLSTLSITTSTSSSNLTQLPAPAQFLLLAILNEYVQRCSMSSTTPSIMQEKKDIRDLQDITTKLVESCSTIAGACLEQTTWLRRNLAVREDVLMSPVSVSENKSTSSSLSSSTLPPPPPPLPPPLLTTTTITPPPNSAYSVQAQIVLAEILAPLLDIVYGAVDNKERVITLLTNLMYNITPYLRNHTIKNIPSFIACSQLISSLSGYQYTRKSWRKDVLDLLLDSSFFQMPVECISYWKIIVDNLMTHDTTTFRDLMNRISSSISQSSGISLFSSREQEYEQRAQLLKRLAFVILCSEQDQYHKYIPDIQERLADSLRLPQVIPTIQAQVFLCFRVLLIRMSPQHTTSLWPVIVSELVQVFLYIEQELGSGTDTEEFSRCSSSHIKLLSALDSSWTVNANNGLLLGHGHPHWLQLQLAAAKLLDLALLLPAHKLPQFQMYRWAFVGDVNNDKTKYSNNDIMLNHDFVPHILRIAKIMNKKFSSNQHSSQEKKILVPGKLILTTNKINSLEDLHYFFTVLSEKSNTDNRLDTPVNIMDLESVIEQDFLETMSLSSLSTS
ncbi:hypothetical protein KQX54_000954 [Cotesia glomerata]|uniref:DOP1-like C-terminal domain-containing protein n=1 Tax=Cotesia glomerata TaxID=32391 RepID=A0AAV7INR9_COTGL|nr:hypothetical protein KQX54_000954 [Cotesia glomerata]